MDKFSFRVSIETHEQTGDVMAVYFQIRKGKSSVVKEYAGGDVFADYNKKGELLRIEMLAPCKVSVLDKIVQQAIPRRFIRKNIPRGMLATA